MRAVTTVTTANYRVSARVH